MLMAKRPVRGLLVLALLAAPVRLARAEEPLPTAPTAPTASTLSLAEALRLAEVRAPQVRVASLGVAEAEAHRTAAGLRFDNPRLSVEGRPAVTGGRFFGDMGYGGTLEVPFDVGGAPPARSREAERGVDLARADVDVERRRARSEVWSAYVRVRAAERRVEEIQSVLRIADRIVQASARRAASGAAGEVDETAARSELAVLQGLAESAARQRETQLMALRGLLDLDAGRAVTLVTPLAEPAPAAPEANLVERALSRRPELARSRARVAQLMATDERLARELFPRLSVYLGVDAAPVSPIFGQLGLSVQLPVAQRNQRARAVAQRQRSAEEVRTALLLRQIVRDVSAARAAYEGRRRELDLLSRTALPAAERTLELVELGWSAGRFDIFRVTSAARDVARVRALRIDALEAAWLEHVALDYTVGGIS